MAFWLIGLTCAWGAGWPVMKIALAELPIFTFRAITGWGGGALMLAFLAIKGLPLLPQRGEWRMTAIAALFNVTGWFYFTAVALTLLPAGRSVVLGYTMPLWSILAARVMVGDPITPAKIGGLLFGMAAVGVLIGDDLLRLGQAPLGIAAVLAAAASWGIGTVVQKRVWQTPVLTLIAWQLLIGGTPMVALALLYDTAPFARLTGAGVASVLYVLLIACLLGYWAWFNIVERVPMAVASLAVLPVPLIGVVTSALLLGEAVGWPEVGALILITASMVTVMPLPRLKVPWR
jgi:drug/metabolite transporter (DMT)-like permease